VAVGAVRCQVGKKKKKGLSVFQFACLVKLSFFKQRNKYLTENEERRIKEIKSKCIKVRERKNE
jgi:hypothetical protein